MTDDKRPLKVFLCHASADKPKARELYRYLKRHGLQPWLNAEDLLPGQNWQVEIPKALECSDAIIICLSKGSVDKEGYFQKEIKFALDKALEMPEGHILPIPARLDECEVPRLLSTYQWVDLFDEGGYERLLKALKVRAVQVEQSGVRIIRIGDDGPNSPEKSKSDVIAAIPRTGIVPSSSIRLKQSLEFINDTKNSLEKITVPRVAQLLGFLVTHEVEACFEGKAEASIYFLEKFAIFFGINKQWLQFGEGFPFETAETPQIDPLNYYERLKSLNVQEIIFVREIPEGRTTIVLKLSDFKFTYLPNVYKVGGDIGRRGLVDLISLYKLIGKIDKEGLSYSSRQVPKNDFDKLVEGEMFPGRIASYPSSYWTTDFLSPDFDENSAKQYDSELWKAYKIIEKEIKPIVQPPPQKPVEHKLPVIKPKIEPRVDIVLKPAPKALNSQPVQSRFNQADDRRLDILGVCLALGGFVIVLSLFSSSHNDSVTGIMMRVLDFLFGYGAIFLADLFIGFGVWIMIRRIHHIPPISWKRISGIILLFLLLQTAIHGLTNYGGWIGSLFYSVLYKNLGTFGAVTVIIAWGIFGLSLVFKTSVAELLLKLNFTQNPKKKTKKH